jgi:DNA-binding NtrC family response regulator
MPYRRKILIIENDDFLREILGNLLHKNDNYIINGSCIQSALSESTGMDIDTVILGTSCSDYKNKKSLHFIRQKLGDVNFYVINNQKKDLDFLPAEQQIKISHLSIEEILRELA